MVALWSHGDVMVEQSVRSKSNGFPSAMTLGAASLPRKSNGQLGEDDSLAIIDDLHDLIDDARQQGYESKEQDMTALPESPAPQAPVSVQPTHWESKYALAMES